MHMNLRRYPIVGVSRATIEEAVEKELLPLLKADAGFAAYYALWDEGGAGVSVSSFADAEAAHNSTSSARRWLASHTDFFPSRGEEFSGECFVQKEAPRGARAGSRPYVLVRLLTGVPATQDTRAFVEQRTLPLIERSPGFRAVWMARSDREADGAAVVTFFDSPSEAMACHETAVGLLREGLPTVSVMTVVQGHATISVGPEKASL
jgi:hypothetical protein